MKRNEKLKIFASSLMANILGARLNKKIVVFESDDWGAIRMASRKDYDYFRNKGFGVENCPFNRFDTLESDEDIDDLALILNSVKDSEGQHAKFTLNFISANPDFEKIRESGFQRYYFESILKTYERHSKSQNVFGKIIKNRELQLFDIQFHGREHLNIRQWIKALQKKEVLALEAFNRNMYSIHNKLNRGAKSEYLEAFGESGEDIILKYDEIVSDGIKLFKEIWGSSPISFIAPCYVWPVELELTLKKNGIQHIQSAPIQKVPIKDTRKGFKKIRHFYSQRNSIGMVYTIRNVLFEPSIDSSIDWVAMAMKQIAIAFAMKKPAIISSHRLNYVGGIDEKNKINNLLLLKTLIKKIRETYPDVIFKNTYELYNILRGN